MLRDGVNNFVKPREGKIGRKEVSNPKMASNVFQVSVTTSEQRCVEIIMECDTF